MIRFNFIMRGADESARIVWTKDGLALLIRGEGSARPISGMQNAIQTLCTLWGAKSSSEMLIKHENDADLVVMNGKDRIYVDSTSGIGYRPVPHYNEKGHADRMTWEQVPDCPSIEWESHGIGRFEEEFSGRVRNDGISDFAMTHKNGKTRISFEGSEQAVLVRFHNGLIWQILRPQWSHKTPSISEERLAALKESFANLRAEFESRAEKAWKELFPGEYDVVELSVSKYVTSDLSLLVPKGYAIINNVNSRTVIVGRIRGRILYCPADPQYLAQRAIGTGGQHIKRVGREYGMDLVIKVR